MTAQNNIPQLIHYSWVMEYLKADFPEVLGIDEMTAMSS